MSPQEVVPAMAHITAITISVSSYVGAMKCQKGSRQSIADL